MPEQLRNSLWNVLQLKIWDAHGFKWYAGNRGDIGRVASSLWFGYFKQPIADIPSHPDEVLDVLRAYYSKAPWNEVYDFLEALLETQTANRAVTTSLNFVLERELAAYRIIAGRFVEVTAAEELEALEQALTDTKFGPVAAHLKSALEKLSNRQRPDYRNSIKESISAVEAMANLVVGQPRATLEHALRTLERNERLHPALTKGFRALYAYTGDAQGIRHALMDEPTLTAADAKFFLLSCTSFINYLKSKV